MEVADLQLGVPPWAKSGFSTRVLREALGQQTDGGFWHQEPMTCWEQGLWLG